MAILEPHNPRTRIIAYGSRTLIVSQRVGPGSTLITDTVRTDRDWIKTFYFRGNLQGSWGIEVSPGGEERYGRIAEGTFPASQGSYTARSFESAAGLARARVRLSAAGSVSVYYAGLLPFR